MARFVVLLNLTMTAFAAVSHGAVPSLEELLDKHTATVDRCVKSFAIKTELTSSADVKQTNEPRIRPGRSEQHTITDLRYDGRRARHITHSWGKLARETRTRKNPKVMSQIYDTDFRATYQGDIGGPGYIKYNIGTPPQRYIDNVVQGLGGFGAAFGFIDGGRMETVLRRCGNATVRGQTENVNGSDCYVIDADTDYGRLTLWIDPEHGYLVAKERMVVEAGDKLSDYTFVAGQKQTSVMTIVAFKQINGVWIPTEKKGGGSMVHPGRTYITAATHAKLIEFLIGPDHEALKSFALDDFPDGSKVFCFENRRGLPGNYVWQDGKVLDEKGHKVDYKTNEPEK